MSITRTKFATQSRTWITIAGLAALFVGLGGLFGGSSGILLFAAIAVVFNLVMFWFSAKLALKASKARPVDRSEAPELYREVEEIAGRGGRSSRARCHRPRRCGRGRGSPGGGSGGRRGVPRHGPVA